MKPGRWDTVKELFQQALEQDPGSRASFLDRVCGDDTTLRFELESLLASHQSAEFFLSDPPSREAAEVIASGEGALLHGQQLGPYKVLQRVGRGGTGAVYLAVRADDEFQQRVAIKVIRQGMATEDLLRRFRSERQILASIDHPNIARLLDGGSTDDGLPYFVMEYIEGEPITRYCELNQLTIDQRLDLFCTVCDAVQLAHQNLVVHRDLKPGNIIVTQDGTPKLLDFGIAKLLNPELSSEPHEPTVLELRVMTPEFASPEQVQGKSITTASDVYSLGVLLYELLTGHRPYRLTDLPLHEIELVVCTQRPELPSVAAGTDTEVKHADGTVREITAASVARVRRLTPDRLRRALEGDLDNIVLRALRKEPLRRYGSVEQFAGDIDRYRKGMPVVARPDAFSYRAGKFLRRNRLAVAVASTVVVLGLAIAATIGVQSARVAAARDRAERAAETATVVSGFLQEMFGAADPLEGIGRNVTVVEAVEAAVPRIAQTFAAEPVIEAAIRYTVGQTFARLGRFDEGEDQLRQSLQIRRSLYGEDHQEIAECLNGLGELRYDHGDLDGAERLYRSAYEMRQRLFGPQHAEVATSLDNLANVYHERGELEQAERMYREGLAMRRAVLGDEHKDVASSLNNVAVVLHDQDRLEAAQALYRESLALTRRALGDEHPDVATGLNNLAALLHDQGDLAGAEPLYRESLAMTRKLLGESHPALAVSLNNLGSLLQDRQKFREAEQFYREAIDVTRDRLGDDHYTLGGLIDSLATLFMDREDYAAAEPLYREALETMRRTLDGDDPAIAMVGVDHGYSLLKLARHAEAEELMLDGYRLASGELEPGDEILREIAGKLAELYDAWGKPEEAARFRAVVEAEPRPKPKS